MKKKNPYSYELFSCSVPSWLLTHPSFTDLSEAPHNVLLYEPVKIPTQQHSRWIPGWTYYTIPELKALYGLKFLLFWSREMLQCPTMHQKPYIEYPRPRHDPGTAHGCRFAWWHKDVSSPCGCQGYTHWIGSNSSKTSSSTVKDGPKRQYFRRWKATACGFFQHLYHKFNVWA